MLAISVATSATGAYLLVDWVLLQPAKSDGARDSVKIILAVTGRVPFQYKGLRRQMTPDKLSEWACEGREMLTRYRSVELFGEAQAKVLDGDGDANRDQDKPATSYYLLQGSDKTFVLLGAKGTVIKSFGDAAFSLHESSIRPLSEMGEKCEASK